MTEQLGRLRTAEGTNTGDFTPGDWSLLLSVSFIWGSSFLWIAIGLDSLGPAAVAFLRTALGGAALWLYPPARRAVDRSAWPAIAAIGVAGNAGTYSLKAAAEATPTTVAPLAKPTALTSSVTPSRSFAVACVALDSVPISPPDENRRWTAW